MLSLFTSSKDRRLIYLYGEWIWKKKGIISDFENLSKPFIKNGTISAPRAK